MRSESPRHLRVAGGVSLIATLIATGCRSPLDRDPAADLQATVRAAVDRELDGLPDGQSPQTTEAGAVDLSKDLDSRLDALAEIGPQVADGGASLDIGNGLDGLPREVVTIGLDDAIRRAVVNNLGVQRTRVDQAVTAAEIIRSEAAFDAVLGAGANFARIDEPGNDILLSGPAGPPIVIDQGQDVSQWGFTTDLTKRLTAGGSVQLGLETERQRIFNTPQEFTYDPAWQSAVTLGLAQPLLRGFGEDVNTAQIKLAENNDRRAQIGVRSRLLDLVVEIENAYWNLAFARQQVVVAQWLVAEGERIRDILANRRGFDTTLAQYADAVATVESRKTRLIQALRDVGRAADALKAVINDPDLAVGGEQDVVPIDALVEAAYTFDLRDEIATAMSNSPAIDAAIIGIEDASIREIVARNGRLPALDLRAEFAWLGLAEEFGSSVSAIDGDFVDYIVGMQFSQPIGNRAAESVLLQARLRRSAAVIDYRRAVQRAVLDVKNAVRDIDAGYALVAQARNFRLAQAENLRALEALRETLAALTPEFLNLLFQRQERLGEAQLQEFGASVTYNVAIAQLERSTGTGLEKRGIDVVVVAPDESPEPALVPDGRFGTAPVGE
jgi:outer membrane protein